MMGNWPKAIEYTAAMLVAIVAGVVVSFALDSLWPIATVVLACCAVMGYFITGNMILEWRVNRLERQARSTSTV